MLSQSAICSTSIWNGTGTIVSGITSSRGSTGTLLNYPYDVGVDGYQNVYVVDTYNHRIQYFARGSTTGTTVAGNSGAAGSGYSELNYPAAIRIDGNRGMYILDSSNCRVLKWQLGDPLGYVIAGGYGCSSQLNQISTSYAMFLDSQTNIYISDNANHRVTLWLSNNFTSGILVLDLFAEKDLNINIEIYFRLREVMVPVQQQSDYIILGESMLMVVVQCILLIDLIIEFNCGNQVRLLKIV